MNTILYHALYAVVYWTLGFIATTQTAWVVRTEMTIKRKYPKALPSRLPERPWYPAFLKTLGSFCLLIAGWHTVLLTLALWRGLLLGR